MKPHDYWQSDNRTMKNKSSYYYFTPILPRLMRCYCLPENFLSTNQVIITLLLSYQDWWDVTASLRTFSVQIKLLLLYSNLTKTDEMLGICWLPPWDLSQYKSSYYYFTPILPRLMRCWLPPWELSQYKSSYYYFTPILPRLMRCWLPPWELFLSQYKSSYYYFTPILPRLMRCWLPPWELFLSQYKSSYYYFTPLPRLMRCWVNIDCLPENFLCPSVIL